MKASLFSLLLVLPVLGQEYTIDPAHSAAHFSVKHMMIANVRGEFRAVAGMVVLDEKAPAKSKVEAKIEAASITTNDDKRDGHLKSPDFFDIAKFPSLEFKSTKVQKKGSAYLVTGDLTIHGVTKPVVLTVDEVTKEVKDPWGMMRVGATATGKVKRQDFGLVWNKALDNGGVLVGDDVMISLDVELTRKP